PVRVRPPGALRRWWLWARRRPALAAVYGLLAAVAGVGGAGWGAGGAMGAAAERRSLGGRGGAGDRASAGGARGAAVMAARGAVLGVGGAGADRVEGERGGAAAAVAGGLPAGAARLGVALRRPRLPPRAAGPPTPQGGLGRLLQSRRQAPGQRRAGRGGAPLG